MKSIVTLKQLVSLVARAAGVDTQMSTRFIDEFTRAVTSGLERDGRVDIAGFGTFSRDGLSGDEINFVPTDDIAAAINAPFDMFEAEELADEYIDEECVPEPVLSPSPSVPSADSTPEDAATAPAAPPVREPQQMPAPPAVPATKPEPGPAPEPEQTSEPEPAHESVPEPERPPYPAYSEPERQPAPQPASQPEPELRYSSAGHPDSNRHEYERHPSGSRHRKRSGFGPYVLMMIGFVMLSFFIGAVAGYFAYPMLNKALAADDTEVPAGVEPIGQECPEISGDDSVQSEETPSASDETEAQVSDVEPLKPETVTDTVKAGNSLARIARTHYGKSDFWVYIYIANESKLGNPDRIASGTILVIPPAEQYGIDCNDPESIKRARAKASEIYNKYH